MTIDRLMEYLADLPKDAKVFIGGEELHALPRYSKVAVEKKTGKRISNQLRRDPYAYAPDEIGYMEIIEF